MNNNKFSQQNKNLLYQLLYKIIPISFTHWISKQTGERLHSTCEAIIALKPEQVKDISKKWN